MMQSLLAREVYAPLRAAGIDRAAAVASTFGASALLHLFPLLVVGAPGEDLLDVATFFAVQSCGVLAEGALSKAYGVTTDELFPFGFGQVFVLAFQCATVRLVSAPFMALQT